MEWQVIASVLDYIQAFVLRLHFVTMESFEMFKKLFEIGRSKY